MPLASLVLSFPATWIISYICSPTFSHHKAFVRVNYEEESEKNVDGDDFQGVQNKHSDLHVAGTVEACSRLTKK